MKYLKLYEQFINESYLKGGRQPLYHLTDSIDRILNLDKLKVNKPSFGIFSENEKSISFTRSLLYGHNNENVRLVLDTDLLNRYYTIYKVDEVAIAAADLKKKEKGI